MKHPKLIYSDFVSNRPEPTTLLELWCLLGGFVLLIFVSIRSGMQVSDTPRIETILAMVYPAIFFFLHYMSREFTWFKSILILSTAIGFISGLLLIVIQYDSRTQFIGSDIALSFFCLVCLLLVVARPLRKTI